MVIIVVAAKKLKNNDEMIFSRRGNIGKWPSACDVFIRQSNDNNIVSLLQHVTQTKA